MSFTSRWEEVTEAAIRSLEKDKAQESVSLEFKQELPGTGDSQKKELLKDVCGMANALGGDILFGMKEKDDGRAW